MPNSKPKPKTRESRKTRLATTTQRHKASTQGIPMKSIEDTIEVGEVFKKI